MWLVANDDVPDVVEGVSILKGERILMEMSRKFTPEDIRQLAFQSDFYVQVSPAFMQPFPASDVHACKHMHASSDVPYATPFRMQEYVIVCCCFAQLYAYLYKQGLCPWQVS